MLTAERPSIALEPDEIERITGCKRPGDQVEELKKQGFYRARRARDGSVVLERAHYDSVCAAPSRAANEPTLRP